MSNNQRDSELSHAISNIPISPVKLESIDFSDYNEISLSELSSFGITVSTIISSFLANSSLNATLNNGTFYKAVLSNGSPTSLQYACKNGVGLSSGVCINGKLASAHFIPAEIPSLTAATACIAFIALTVICITQKLDAIQETQQEILNFLKTEQKSRLEGNVKFLSDIYANYKFNWNNSTYKNSAHIKVFDIMQSSEQEILFSQRQIAFILKKKSQNPKQQLKTIQTEFKNYQLALFLYGFSSFFEIVLSENFSEKYLTAIETKLNEYSYKYHELYTICFDWLQELSLSSISSSALGILSDISSNLGNVIAKIPVISKSQIDENLIDAGLKLDQSKNEITTSLMKEFIGNKNSCINSFSSAVKNIKTFYSKSVEVVFDDANIYYRINT